MDCGLRRLAWAYVEDGVESRKQPLPPSYLAKRALCFALDGTSAGPDLAGGLVCGGSASARSRKCVSNLPATNAGSFRMRLWSGIVVLIPSTTKPSSAHFIR